MCLSLFGRLDGVAAVGAGADDAGGDRFICAQREEEARCTQCGANKKNAEAQALAALDPDGILNPGAVI